MSETVVVTIHEVDLVHVQDENTVEVTIPATANVTVEVDELTVET